VSGVFDRPAGFMHYVDPSAVRGVQDLLGRLENRLSRDGSDRHASSSRAMSEHVGAPWMPDGRQPEQANLGWSKPE
jgi:hypothetical protein